MKGPSARDVAPAAGGFVELDDAELVGRALSGSAWAEASLCRRYARPLVGMLSRLLGDRHDADDIAQDTFVAALERLERLERPDAFRAWLFAIAANLAKKRLRRRRLERWLGVAPAAEATLPEPSGGPSAAVMADIALVRVRLEALPSDLRVAWCLRYVEGYKLEEVAQMCGCALATIKRRLTRASRRLDAAVRLEEEKR